MLGQWWILMASMGIALGSLGARTSGAARVFMETLAVPIALVVTRLMFPFSDSPYYLAYLLTDLVIVALTAHAGNHLVRRRLGWSDRGGYRNDRLGH